MMHERWTAHRSGLTVSPTVLATLVLLSTFACAAVPCRALNWEIATVDGPGDVGAYASIALDQDGNPGISYCSSSADDLKYAHLSGGTWFIETVDAAGRTGWYTSLAFDAGSHPCIAYWDLTNSALRYARWTGSVWVKETVDNSAYVGQTCSLALDSLGNPAISYYDYTNGDLRYAKWDAAAWHIEVVDNGASLMGAGLYTSLVLDAQERPHISYADHTAGVLRYAWWDGVQWNIETINGGTPIGTSIQLDANQVPHISYAYQFGQGSHLKYAARTGPGGTWQVQIVHAGGQVGLYSSLRLLPSGDPCILSWDLGNGIVDYDWFSAGAWSRDEIETMGWTDQWCALVLDDAGRPHAAYRSATEQDLHYAVGSDPAAVPEVGLSDPLARLCVFPNPARRGESIRLAQSMPASARLRIFDLLGREVADPITVTATGGGSGAIHWVLPPTLQAGVYLARAEAAGLELNGRLVIVR
jgi:hypothetical protein